MKKGLLFLLLLMMVQLSGKNMSDLNGVSVSNVKVPFYKKDILQSMVFAATAEYRARLLYGNNVIINMLQKKVNPDKIQDDWNLQVYPLNAPLSQVARFWAGRMNYCDAVIFTPEGILNQAERSAASEKSVKMRSPLLDLDGTGFAADFKRRQIKVNSDVRIVLRNKSSDPRTFGSKIPERYEYMQGSSDMLHIDTAGRRIMLLGQVTVRDGKIKLTCDRLTVEMGEDPKLKEKSSMNFSGVKKLHADGTVKVIRLRPEGAPAEEAQELRGDHLVYDVAKGVLVVTGDKKQPELASGKGFLLKGRELVFFREKQQLIVPGNCWMRFEQKGEKNYLLSDYGNFNFSTGVCDFLGRVRASTPQHELACSKMRVILERSAKTPVAASKQRSDSPLAGTGDLDTGSMEFKRALCKGHVKMFRRETKGFSTLSASEAELNYFEDKALFTGNVVCSSGGNTLTTPRLRVNLKKSAADPGKREIASAEALESVKVVSSPAANGEKSTLTARSGSFDYKADRIDFNGNVNAVRGKSSLKCDQLTLFLDAKGSDEKAVSIPGLASGAAGSGKTLKRVTASGNALMQDGGNSLAGERLEYFFTPAAPNASSQPGLFQSGSLRLVKVTGDGSVKLSGSGQKKSSASADPGVMLGRNSSFKELTAGHLVSDLRSNITTFTEKVVVTDGVNRMDCGQLELFSKAAEKKAASAQQTAAPADPDADPFDLPAENSVPSTIALGNGLELDRAAATENVIISRKAAPDAKGEKVYCDRAVFNSKTMTVECTSQEGRRPRAEGAGRTHVADKFTIYLKDERLESTGEAITQ